jgi:hypothetical protein
VAEVLEQSALARQSRQHAAKLGITGASTAQRSALPAAAVMPSRRTTDRPLHEQQGRGRRLDLDGAFGDG